MTLLDWREEPISRKHNRKGFDCGQADLNDFLTKYARQAHGSGASKTFVAVDDDDGTTIYGFYTLSPAQVEFDLTPERARPAGGGRHPVGGFRLGRLAVSTSLQGRGLGGELLIAAARRCIQASVQVGGSLLLIDAKDKRAAEWYKSYGALEIPKTPLALVLPYSVIIDVMERAGKPVL
ncbi:GNAT family N-acetyltransferase [Rhizobium sp. P40RR-XXII]|uniref:GNAT family N-acetyltransferase n=1 Tax=unclassified Rhizobium TaxID=2613769 RepID=UPI0014568125|nr:MULTISPECIES: GNAT family N-acetyltransferase [unclassified Rhizobium]NLR85781.1 GNAT family N-acetyltransferase [Rhizobium sp. P28RR-XV]NLS19439.1 GNAT family N-acetyltransferase [Rhizobium sp. P40RR-XXII]